MKKILKKVLGKDLIEVFFDPQFSYFILSVVFSQIAMNMLNVVLIFLVYYLTSSSFFVSLLLLTVIVPQIFLSFIGGIVADLRNKKIILAYGNLIRALFLIILFFNSKSIVVILIVSFLFGTVTQFYIPAETPIIPELVKKKYLTAANSAFGMALFGSVLIGYVLAGPLVTVLGRSNVFLFISILLIIAAFFILLIPSRLMRKSRENHEANTSISGIKDSLGREFKHTFKMLRKTKGVLGSFLLLTFSQIIVLILATVVPGYARTVLGVPAEDISLILFAPAAFGMIVASILMGGPLSKVNKNKLMSIGILISGLSLSLFPFTSRIVSREFIHNINDYLPHVLQITRIHMASTIAFFAGFANALIFVPSQTIIQQRIPEVFRSKIYGLLFSLTGVLSLLPIIITGGIADILGVGTVLFIIGFLLIIMGISRTVILKE